MCKIKDYPGLYVKAREQVRLTGIKSEMPGYEMLIKAAVIYKVEGNENLYDKVAQECSVIPNQGPLLKDRHPVEQMLIEAMRSIGIGYNNVLTFVAEIADNM